MGPKPIDVLEKLCALPNARFTRGNTDRYIISGDRPPPDHSQVEANPDLLPVFKEVAETIAWTLGALSTGGWLDVLDAMPLEQRLTLPDGTRLLGVHGAPGDDGGPGLRPDYPEEENCERLRGASADLICVGHTHWPLNTYLDGVHVVNLGSVSNPMVPDLRAWYVLLEADTSGYRIEHRQAAYDREAVIAQLEALRHPGRNYIARFMRGERIRDWPLLA